MRSPSSRSPLQRAARSGVIGLALLAVAGLRHHLVWGRGAGLAFSLRPLLDGLETACVVGFAWFGARCWLGGMAAVRASSPGPRRLLAASLPLLALAVLVPTFLTADITDYVLRGRIVALHGGNPYVQMASEFPDDPFLVYGDERWKGFPLPYGPLVADLQAALAAVAHLFAFLPRPGEFLIACGLFKAVFAGLLVLCALTARSICARLRPADQDVVFLGVLWNPLLLNEAVAQAHNEGVVLLLLLLAVRFALAERLAAGGFALGLGVLAKIVPILLTPLLLVWSIRRRRVLALVAGGAGIAVVLGFYYLRYFAAPGSLAFLGAQSEVTGTSLPWAAWKMIGVEVAASLAAGRTLLVAVVIAAAVRLWRAPNPQCLLRGSAAALAGLVCFGLAASAPWYHIWWLPLALLLGRGYLFRFAWLVTMTAPLGYLLWTGTRVYDDRHQWLQLSMSLLLPAAAAWPWRGPAAARSPLAAGDPRHPAG